MMAVAVAGCADSRFGADPLYTPFGSRAGEATGTVAPAAQAAPPMAAPTTQVSTQPLPPPYYPPAPVQQQPAPQYSQPSYNQPVYSQPAPQAALPPPPPRWNAPLPPAPVQSTPPQAAYVPPPRVAPAQAAYGRPATVAAAPAPAYRPPGTVDAPRVEMTGAVPRGHGAGDSWSWDGGTAVTVKPGESVELLARRHGVPAQAIMRANNLADPKLIHPGQRLVIPTYTYRPGAPERTASISPQANAALRAANTAAPLAAAPPPPPPVAAPAAAGQATHVVNSGDTLNAIAKRYKVSRAALASANGLTAESRLSIGQRLVIPGAGPAQQTLAPARQPVVQTMPAAPPPALSRRVETPPPAAAPAPVAQAKPEPATETAAMIKPTAAPEEVKEAKSEQRQGVSFRWPVRGRVIGNFGAKPGGERNDGINIAVPEGATIKAAEDGVVAYAGAELKGYGNLVLIRHSDGYVTAYAHNSELLVKRGDSVKRGQAISKAGQSGSVTSPQLHFEVRRGSNPVDPTPLLSGG
jgi:murein DD-endopeptidase MepM/ murein hydrolase activator NlpD